MLQPPPSVAAPVQSGPAACKQAVLQDLLLDRDTLAGLARRHHLPVATLLAWRNPGRRPGEARMDLAMADIPALQSRLAGPA